MIFNTCLYYLATKLETSTLLSPIIMSASYKYRFFGSIIQSPNRFPISHLQNLPYPVSIVWIYSATGRMNHRKKTIVFEKNVLGSII